MGKREPEKSVTRELEDLLAPWAEASIRANDVVGMMAGLGMRFLPEPSQFPVPGKLDLPVDVKGFVEWVLLLPHMELIVALSDIHRAIEEIKRGESGRVVEILGYAKAGIERGALDMRRRLRVCTRFIG
jgi:hypothetical protein